MRTAGWMFGVHLLVLVVAGPSRPSWATPAVAEESWSLELRTDRLVIESRRRPGEDLVEVRAVGTIAAPPAAVERVVDDHGAYSTFMPFVTASQVLSTETSGRRLAHQVLTFPVVAPRDYVVWLNDESAGTGPGRIYRVRWNTAHNVGPTPQPGVVRMPRSDGFWQVEAGRHAGEARVTYTCFTDPGGELPAFVVNLVNRSAIEAVFAAVDARARAAMPQG